MTAPATAKPATPSAASAAAAAADPGYTRLHITPFDADLLAVVLPASVRSAARNISYHGLPTFPEKRYGFVDLPADAADKLRRKLNGALLKGVKLRVEPARPSREAVLYAAERSSDHPSSMPATPEAGRKKALADSSSTTTTTKKDKKNKDKKAKRGLGLDGEEIAGVQLEPGRQVKRGWTEPEQPWTSDKTKAKRAKKEKDAKAKDKSDQPKRPKQKSKYTDKPECLVKTILPANKVAKKSRKADGDEEEDEATKARRRKQEKKAREVVVHEFAHTTKFPTFLKSSAGDNAGGARKKNLEYVDGTGWVDEDGNVVQPLKSTRPAAMTAKVSKKKAPKAAAAAKIESESETSSEFESESESNADTSSSEDSSSEEEEEEEEEEVLPEAKAKTAEVQEVDGTAELSSPRPKSSGSVRSLTIKIPPPPTLMQPPATPATKVHPLEALYKRQKADGDSDKKKKASTDAEPFSFFGASADGDNDLEDEDAMDVDGQATQASNQPPMTPFTKQEFEWRHVRSAAPTPDTAHPSRVSSFKWPVPGDDSDEEDEDGGDDGGQERQQDENENEDEEEEGGAGASKGKDKAKDDAATNDFQSWFWENRGDLNRSWKRRRKAAAKEKRYRENRARAERAI